MASSCLLLLALACVSVHGQAGGPPGAGPLPGSPLNGPLPPPAHNAMPPLMGSLLPPPSPPLSNALPPLMNNFLPPAMNNPPPAFYNQPPTPPPFLPLAPKSPLAPRCPPKPCLANLLCPFGVLPDRLGCPACVCRPGPMCPRLRCPVQCPFGFLPNKLGCPTCLCRTPFLPKPRCQIPRCAPDCKLVTGLTGCPVCDCLKGPRPPNSPQRRPDDN